MLMLTARQRAAERTAPPVSLMSSPGLQIGQWQQLHQTKCLMVTFSIETCVMPAVWDFQFVFCFTNPFLFLLLCFIFNVDIYICLLVLC